MHKSWGELGILSLDQISSGGLCFIFQLFSRLLVTLNSRRISFYVIGFKSKERLLQRPEKIYKLEFLWHEALKLKIAEENSKWNEKYIFLQIGKNKLFAF